MSKVQLECVFLKNVLFYLPTLVDISCFEEVCKKCSMAIATVFINPFKLTQFYSFNKIIKIFPKLQTYYCSKLYNPPKKQFANEIPLMEIGELDECCNFGIFSTNWFAGKVRKMRVTKTLYTRVTKNYLLYTNLKIVSIDIARISKSFLVVQLPPVVSVLMSMKTIEKMTIYISNFYDVAGCLNLLKTHNNPTCQYTIVSRNIYDKYAFHYMQTMDYSILEHLQRNVHVYLGTLDAGKDYYLNVQKEDYNVSFKKRLPTFTKLNNNVGAKEPLTLQEMIDYIINNEVHKVSFKGTRQTKKELSLGVLKWVTDITLKLVVNDFSIPKYTKRLCLQKCRIKVFGDKVNLKTLIIHDSFIQGDLNIDEMSVFDMRKSSYNGKLLNNRQEQNYFELNRIEFLSYFSSTFYNVIGLKINESVTVNITFEMLIDRGGKLILKYINNMGLELDFSCFNFTTVELESCNFKSFKLGEVSKSVTFKDLKQAIICLRQPQINNRIEEVVIHSAKNVFKNGLVCDNFKWENEDKNDTESEQDDQDDLIKGIDHIDSSEESSEDSESEPKKKKKAVKKAPKPKK
ncbi:hypothetical protein EIN_155210 [Entamoeba invadens IP1]|uniref:Uncharacterized protein n=1 Tax=Entamoeba invadens IP1 TaxID=370355 RepID=A0A0A1U948_ENTIV|nr:hypothetical protein EIN_155210 [Entamoeba invadens IP1]ELP91414.1 hypothetical protein EIN_155210 [Entamoeba invadens IP1]|eukprot:XP_004258185.1 hypothetical protein EIN_155210 [Entamoeba invadens IP1]